MWDSVELIKLRAMLENTKALLKESREENKSLQEKIDNFQNDLDSFKKRQKLLLERKANMINSLLLSDVEQTLLPKEANEGATKALKEGGESFSDSEEWFDEDNGYKALYSHLEKEMLLMWRFNTSWFNIEEDSPVLGEDVVVKSREGVFYAYLDDNGSFYQTETFELVEEVLYWRPLSDKGI